MSIQQRSLAKRLNKYDDVCKLKRRKQFIQYLFFQKNLSNQWSDVAIDIWWKTLIKSFLIKTMFQSMLHKVDQQWNSSVNNADYEFIV